METRKEIKELGINLITLTKLVTNIENTMSELRLAIENEGIEVDSFAEEDIENAFDLLDTSFNIVRKLE